MDPFFENRCQILQKEERTGVIILVFDAVIDYQLDCLDLVVSECIVDGRSVVEFPLLTFQIFLSGQLLTFWNLIFVKEWEFAVKVIVELFI